MADNINYKTRVNKCIVLDLDQTLIATQKDLNSIVSLGILSKPELMPLRNRIYNLEITDFEKKGEGSSYSFWGITRPHIKEFLVFCFSYFEYVVVWSAGKKRYVEAIVDHIFKDIQMPHLVLTYDDITTASDGSVEKPLEKVFSFFPKGQVSFKNILALDDNPTTFRHNPKNAVLIPEYDPPLNVNAMSKDDPTLLQFMYWLRQKDVSQSTNVETLDKKNIFSTSVASYQKLLDSAAK